MKIATSRVYSKDPDAIDTTVKSASSPEGKALAPTWGMVKAYKDQEVNYGWDAYTADYLALLRKRYAQDKTPFLNILSRERVVLTCYCQPSWHCHRHLAVDILQKIAKHHHIELIAEGEI
jgi:uncharacterized protein YeaO (DUF488 family)